MQKHGVFVEEMEVKKKINLIIYIYEETINIVSLKGFTAYCGMVCKKKI
jgi:hypothetical protein